VSWRYLINVLEIFDRCLGDIRWVSPRNLINILKLFLGVLEIFLGVLEIISGFPGDI